MEDPNRGRDVPQAGGAPEAPAPGQPQAPQGPVYQSPPNADGAVASLVLGILGITICSICAPFAWWQGAKARTAVDASGGALGGRGLATAGWIMGIIGTVIIILGVLLLVVLAIGGGLTSD